MNSGTLAQELCSSGKFAIKILMLLGFYDCHDTLERLDDYLDRELSPGEQRQVKIHLAICFKCAKLHRFERGFIDDVRAKLEHVEAPPELIVNIRQSLQAIEE